MGDEHLQRAGGAMAQRAGVEGPPVGAAGRPLLLHLGVVLAGHGGSGVRGVQVLRPCQYVVPT